MDEELRAELRRRVKIDQAARERLIALLRPDGTLPEDGAQASADVEAIDRDNTRWLRDVLHRSGWPRRSSVGESGARDAWLLAQHADRDPPFQRECLGLARRRGR